MEYQKDVLKVNRNLDLLAPKLKTIVLDCLLVCEEIGYPARVFEGYRSPERQNYLYSLGRSIPGKIVTKRKAWGSWHQLGLAVDIAFYHNNEWTWDGPWEKTAEIFTQHGLQWLYPFEKAHFQLTGGLKIKEAAQIYTSKGPAALWSRI